MPPETLDTFVAPRYRSAGRRKEANNDRRAAADAPLAALRGFLSGVAGAPGDIEGLVRMLPGFNEETVLPTSDDVEKMLPLRSASATPLGRAATGAAQLGGGFYVGPGSPLRAIAAAPRAVSKASRDFAAAAGGSGSNVVKNRGGNWLAGSAEDALRGLRRNDNFSEAEAIRRAQGMPEAEIQAWLSRVAPDRSANAALNTWIDKQLTRYVKNDMATPEDPIRALAERGVLHYEPRGSAHAAEEVRKSAREFARKSKSSPDAKERNIYLGKRMGKSDLARNWEDATDEMLIPGTASHYANGPNLALVPGVRDWFLKTTEENPWLLKVPPETSVTRLERGAGLARPGFSHLIDELRNATNPTSGLPRELLLKYESLPQLSVPQAVERVAKINEWRAAQKVAADQLRANNAATQVFKDYPDKGFKWVELRAPDRFETPAQQEEFGDLGRYANARLSEALKYEGETMGHCVGGYCPDVLEGRSRIYSLRDAKGQPHVTVEVAPSQRTNVGRQDIPDRYFDEALGMLGGERPGLDDAKINDLALELYHMENPPAPELSRIIQIKGKANRAPNEEYLPYVQDFVRSGNWSEVGDLKNTGLLRAGPDRFDIPKGDKGGTIPRFQDLGIEPGYFTNDELLQTIEAWRNKTPGAAQYATGGLVSSTDYDPSAVDAIVEQLRAEFA